MAKALADPGTAWGRVPIAQIEDLHDAVLGAGLDVVQLSHAPLSGSLAFAQAGDITYSSGFIGGHVGLTGPLSAKMVTLGVGLSLPAGSRHWLTEVKTCSVAVFFPGDKHESFYMPGSLYATATLSFERIEEVAAQMGLVLGNADLKGTGICQRTMRSGDVALLRQEFAQVHRGAQPALGPALGRATLECLVRHLAREPRLTLGTPISRRQSQIVRRAQAFIEANLDVPLSIDDISRAAYTSHRTLHRAFVEFLDETPQSYVRKLRLNRIRHELAEEPEARCTVTLIANRWGISELGRLSGWYRELFGELPSQTLARAHRAEATV